jgi:hypothetical protein
MLNLIRRFAPPRLALGLSLLALLPLSAAAGDEGRFGLVARAQSTSSIGVQWHVSENVALRPALLFRYRSNTTLQIVPQGGDTISFETSQTTLGAGLDMLFSLPWRGDLVPYLVGGVSYSSLSQDYPLTDAGTIHFERGRVGQFGAQALFGLRYAVSRRFSVFGEAGFSFSDGEEFGLDGNKLHNRSLGTTTAGVGAIFYLK